LQEFTVVCTTCQSRIKVRNPNLIGQIVPCPKCSSMVLIENNNRIVLSPHGDAANSQTETKEALGPLPKLNEAAAQGDNKRGRFRADGSKANGSEQTDGKGSASPQPSESSSVSTAATAVANEAESRDHSGNLADLTRNDWVSAKAKVRRQILLVFFLSLSSCVVTVLLFVLFIRSWGEKTKDTLAQNPIPNQPTLEEVKPPETPPAALPDDSSGENAIEVPAERTEVESTPVDKPTESETELASKPDAEMAITPPDANPNPLENLPSVAPPINNDDNQEAKNTDSSSTTDKTKETAPELPESLRKLATVFDPSLEMRLGELPGSRLQAGLSTPDIAALPVLSTAKLHPPAAPPQDVAKKLSEEIAGIEIQERPLAEVLELWSQLSGVGIEIRWSEIAAVNVEPTQPISVRLGRTSYQDLLTGLIGPLGLEFVSLDKSLVRVAPQEVKVNELLPKAWKVTDLVTDKSPATEIERIVGELNPGLGDVYKFANDEIQWAPNAKAFQKFAVLETLEHLRIMRGIPIASSYKQTLFNRVWPNPSNESATKVVLTQPAVKNVPVIQTLSQAARDAGATVSVDWSGAWEHGLSPFTEDTFLPRGRSLSGLAEAVAFKYGLEVAWLSSNHAVLTTLPRLNHMEMMVHFELSDQRDIESLKRRLSRFSTLSAQDLPSIRFAIDPQSDMLLAIIRPLRKDEVGQRP
jgi:hypothetical protein